MSRPGRHPAQPMVPALPSLPWPHQGCRAEVQGRAGGGQQQGAEARGRGLERGSRRQQGKGLGWWLLVLGRRMVWQRWCWSLILPLVPKWTVQQQEQLEEAGGAGGQRVVTLHLMGAKRWRMARVGVQAAVRDAACI